MILAQCRLPRPPSSWQIVGRYGVLPSFKHPRNSKLVTAKSFSNLSFSIPLFNKHNLLKMIVFAHLCQRLHFSRKMSINAFRCPLIHLLKLAPDWLIIIAFQFTWLTGTSFAMAKYFGNNFPTALHIITTGHCMNSLYNLKKNVKKITCSH